MPKAQCRNTSGRTVQPALRIIGDLQSPAGAWNATLIGSSASIATSLRRVEYLGPIEPATCDVVDRIGTPLVFKPGHCLGPDQRSALVIGAQGGLAPRADHAQALRWSRRGRESPWKRTSRHYAQPSKSADQAIDKVDQLRRETRLLDRVAQGQHGFYCFGIGFAVHWGLLARKGSFFGTLLWSHTCGSNNANALRLEQH